MLVFRERERGAIGERKRECCCEEGELLVVTGVEDGEMVVVAAWPAHCQGRRERVVPSRREKQMVDCR